MLVTGFLIQSRWGNYYVSGGQDVMKVLGACRESSLNLAIRLRGIKAERNQALPVIRETED
jgi:hypothetical protein